MEMILELQHSLQIYDSPVKLAFDNTLKLFFQLLHVVLVDLTQNWHDLPKTKPHQSDCNSLQLFL